MDPDPRRRRGRECRTPASRAVRIGTAVVAALVTAGSVTACGAEPVETVAASDGTLAEPYSSGTTSLDSAGQRFKSALETAGLSDGIPDATLQAIARGVCAQIESGVPEDRILDTVRSIAQYSASVSSRVGDADPSRAVVAAARDTYC